MKSNRNFTSNKNAAKKKKVKNVVKRGIYVKRETTPEVGTMPSDKGLRYNESKPVLSMVLEARHAMDGVARVLMHGREKYHRGNWRKGLNHTEIADSLLRHMTAYLAGETLDTKPSPDGKPGSGLPHVDHILCNALFLAELAHTRKDLDDRPILESAE